MTRNRFLWQSLKGAAVIAALFLCAPVLAQDVTLTSRGGALSLTGRVIGFDGTYVQIESPYGPLTLDYSGVTCTGAACPDPTGYVPEIRFSGAGEMTELLVPALIEGFARTQGYQVELTDNQTRFRLLRDGADIAYFSLRASSSSEGFADLIAHEADVVMSLREVRADEAARAAEIGIGQLASAKQGRIVALDALVPVASSFQNVGLITLSQLADAFAGRLVNWSELGGADQPITLHLPPQRNGLTERFVDDVVRAAGATLAKGVTFHASRAAMLDAVAADVGALGVSSYTDLGITQALTLQDRCGFVAAPRLTALKTEDYPLTAPMFLYLPERRLPQIARDFLRFLRLPAAQLIVRRANFVDQGAIPIPMDAQGQRFANAIAAAGPEVGLGELQRMVRILLPRTRLSTSFRFEVGSTRLDAQSRSNMLALAQAVRDGVYDGRALMLIGFSDGRGDAVANRQLSSARAESVRRDLVELLGGLPDGVMLETEAFGEALPMGCDDTEWGRQTNRRVELWVSE